MKILPLNRPAATRYGIPVTILTTVAGMLILMWLH